MKVLKAIGGIIVWVIVTSIIAIITTRILQWLTGAFNTSTTLGSIMFLIITMPVVFSVAFYVCVMIGAFFASDKLSALTLLIVCSGWQILTLLMNLKSITLWVVTIATLLAFLFVFLGHLGESKENGESK